MVSNMPMLFQYNKHIIGGKLTLKCIFFQANGDLILNSKHHVVGIVNDVTYGKLPSVCYVGFTETSKWSSWINTASREMEKETEKMKNEEMGPPTEGPTTESSTSGSSTVESPNTVKPTTESSEERFTTEISTVPLV